MNTLLLVFFWVIYFSFHSLFAADAMKGLAYKHSFLTPRSYRLVYSLISTLGLLGIIFYLLVTPSQVIFRPSPYVRYLALVFTSWGVMTVMISFRHLSVKAFLGLKRASSDQLITEGLHKYVRHPIYSGTILVVIGMFLYHSTDLMLASSVSILIYLPIGIYLEEKKLIRKFGDEYLAYKASTPAIFPRLF